MAGTNWSTKGGDHASRCLASFGFRGSQAQCESAADRIAQANASNPEDPHPPLAVSITPADEGDLARLELSWDLSGTILGTHAYVAYAEMRSYLAIYYQGWLSDLHPETIEVDSGP